MDYYFKHHLENRKEADQKEQDKEFIRNVMKQQQLSEKQHKNMFQAQFPNLDQIHQNEQDFKKAQQVQQQVHQYEKDHHFLNFPPDQKKKINLPNQNDIQEIDVDRIIKESKEYDKNKKFSHDLYYDYQQDAPVNQQKQNLQGQYQAFRDNMDPDLKDNYFKRDWKQYQMQKNENILHDWLEIKQDTLDKCKKEKVHPSYNQYHQKLTVDFYNKYSDPEYNRNCKYFIRKQESELSILEKMKKQEMLKKIENNYLQKHKERKNQSMVFKNSGQDVIGNSNININKIEGQQLSDSQMFLNGNENRDKFFYDNEKGKEEFEKSYNFKEKYKFKNERERVKQLKDKYLIKI